jgi:hypothetical protein
LPLICVLALAVGGGYLWRAGGSNRTKASSSAKSVPIQQKAPPPPAPPAVAAPQVSKIRQPIFDRNMSPLAVSFKQVSVYIRPSELQEGQKAVEHLATLLDLSAEKVRTELQTERSDVWLKRNLGSDVAKKIALSKYSGVYLVDELQRYYPFHDHAAHVVGFVNKDQGLAGAEFLYDAILSGSRTLASQYLNLPGIDVADIPASGAAAVVSVDIELQIILEKKMQHLLQQTGAQSASAVLIDAGNGEILAMANVPAYDPNVYWKAAVAAHQNRILSEPVPMAGVNAFIRAAAELASGNLPPQMAAREEEAEHVITPRLMKIAKSEESAPAIQESQVWRPGIHLSPPLQWPKKYTQKAEELAGFCAKLGLVAPGSGLGDTRLDAGGDQLAKDGRCSLEDDSWRVFPLNLLAAFSQLTNGGKAISPHLLKGIWRMDNSTFHPTAFQAKGGVGSHVSADFVSFVDGLLPPGPEEALVIESIKSQVRITGITKAKVAEDEPASSIEDAIRFSSLALASGRQEEHQLALLMMVDGASFNLALPSPVRKTAAEIISQGQGLMAKRWGSEPKAPHLESDADLYQQWSQSQEMETPSVASSSTVTLEMPDLIGMSLRKAMQALQSYNMKVNVQGAGTVIKQVPAAGVRLKGINEVKLELRMDIH